MGPVMPFLPIIGSVISAGMSFMGAKKEKEASDMNAASIAAENKESRRKLKDVQQHQASEATARGAASGVKLMGSQELFISTLKDKQAQELAFLKKSGASRVEIERKIGEAQASSGYGKAFGSLLTAGGQFAAQF